MAFVPGFEHDVFISYAHADNPRLVEEDEGYVTKIYENLTHFLTAELGRREYFSIWFDREGLRGNDDFEARLDMAFLNSAVLVSVCSQSYVESAWCRRELLAFSGQTRPPFGLKVGEGGGSFRVFRVEVAPVREPHKDVPGYFFEKMLGHRFYETVDGVDQPFRRSDPDEDDQRYWTAMRRLARDIAQLLRQMKKLALPAPPAPPTGRTVFLAETADDLEDQRSGVKSALEQHSRLKATLAEQGLRVIPEFPLSLGDPNLADGLRQLIRGADMTVHLIGPLPGKTPLNETRPLVQLQWELAGEIAREKGLPRVAWLADGLDPGKVKEQHRVFLQTLEEAGGDAAAAAPPEVLRVGIEELRELLLRRLFPPPGPTHGPTPAPDEEIDRLVYLTYLPDDREGALKIKDALRRERLDVKLFRYDASDPQMLARIHNASLERSDAVVIFYGIDAVWLDQLVEEARDALKARARRNPLKVVCICDGPPDPKNNPVEVDYDKFLVADCRDGLDPRVIREFVEIVKS